MPQKDNKMTSLTINTHEVKNSPIDSTYFRTSDVRPEVVDGKLEIYDGYGTRRSWGTPKVTTEFTNLTDDVLMVEVVPRLAHEERGK